MIKSFQHKGLERFFTTGSKAGIQPRHAARMRRLLAALDEAIEPRQMDVPGWHLHPLTGDLSGFWSIWVNGNWRVIFRFEDQDAVLVDYRDYH